MAARHFNRPFPIELGALGGGIDFPVEVPADAVFQAGVGYRGVVSNDHQYIHPPVTTAIVSVRLGDAPEFVELAAIAIDDHPRSGRQWSPVEIDLAPYAGPATLRLEFRAKRRLGRDRVAWFGSPRIALRPPAPGLGTP